MGLTDRQDVREPNRLYPRPERTEERPERIGWSDILGMVACIVMAIVAFVVLPVMGAPAP